MCGKSPYFRVLSATHTHTHRSYESVARKRPLGVTGTRSAGGWEFHSGIVFKKFGNLLQRAFSTEIQSKQPSPPPIQASPVHHHHRHRYLAFSIGHSQSYEGVSTNFDTDHPFERSASREGKSCSTLQAGGRLPPPARFSACESPSSCERTSTLTACTRSERSDKSNSTINDRTYAVRQTWGQTVGRGVVTSIKPCWNYASVVPWVRNTSICTYALSCPA